MNTLPLHINTPIIYSQFLKNTIGKSVYFKLDSLQPSASFKLRGIGLLCQDYASKGVKQFVASSGGNAGISVAYCGMMFGIPTTIFIPSTSHAIYINEIKSYGAEVIVAGDVWDEAHIVALEYATKHQAAYIPPFDHPMIWEGHATIIQEINATKLRPDAVVAAVGGGGLACGILQGMQECNWKDVPLIAVETLGADSFSQSIKADKLITLDKMTSKATSLGAKRVASRLLQWTHERDVRSVVVTDIEAEEGARAFAKDKRILVELSAGAALSIAYANNPIIQEFKTILVVVCGGVNTSFFQI